MAGCGRTLRLGGGEAGAVWRYSLRAALPVALFYVAFGALYGMLAAQAGWPPLATALASAFVYSGAAQLALVGLLHAQATGAAIVATVAILSLRHLTFTTVVASELSRLRPVLRALAAFGLTDEAFGLTAAHWERSRRDVRYLLGVEAVLWPAWQAGTALGLALANWLFVLNQFSGWQVAFPALFIGLAAPLARGPRLRVAVIAAAAVWLLDLVLPLGVALLAAALLAPLALTTRAGRDHA